MVWVVAGQTLIATVDFRLMAAQMYNSAAGLARILVAAKFEQGKFTTLWWWSVNWFEAKTGSIIGSSSFFCAVRHSCCFRGPDSRAHKLVKMRSTGCFN